MDTSLPFPFLSPPTAANRNNEQSNDNLPVVSLRYLCPANRMCFLIADTHALVQHENNRGNPTTDAPTAEIFPREHPSDTPQIILIDDDSDDDTADHNMCPISSVGSDDPAPKAEPSDEAMTDIHDQQVTTTTYDNTPTQPILSTFDPNQLYNGLFDIQLPNEDIYPERPPSCDTQTQIPNHGPTPQWPPAFLHEASPINNTSLHHEQLPQPMPSDTRAPEAIMAPLPTDQIAPPAPGPSGSSQMQPTAQPCQDTQTTELYSYLNQARNASSQFQLDSDGRLRWIAPKALSGLATKQKPMSARQHEEVRARTQTLGEVGKPYLKFKVSTFANQSRRWSGREIERALRLLRRADARSKTTGGRDGAVLEELLLGLQALQAEGRS